MAISARGAEERDERRRKAVKIVKTRKPEAVSVDFGAIPSHQNDAMCRTLTGCISRLFEDPAVQADYKCWQQERQQRTKGTDS